ncbi:MAG: glutamine synthetase family protein [Lachnospiraceae bacterium]|nr:glutamine synthetase family protein [Lachnospiraceae bacterium]
MDFSDTETFLEEENVKFIRLTFFDVFGRQKNIAIMPVELRRAMKEGISIDGSSIIGFNPLEESDLFLKPDLNTMSFVPWRPLDGRVVRVFCNIMNPDGTVYSKDTRYILKEAEDAAKRKGLRLNFGPEVEFYVFKQDENGNRTDIPLDHAGYMDIEPADKGDNLRRDVCFALLDMGITPESSHHEQGPGQNEIDFRYGSALTTADNTETFKWAVRNIAESSGNWASFAPKPMREYPGNGMHINISVDSEDGQNHMEAFMAGILHYICDMTLFLNPRRNSYYRFGQMEAPTYISWSQQNRSQLIRIPATKGEHKRFELRSPDPEANPYLAFALLIYAGLEGIEQNMKLDEPVDRNLYDIETTEGLHLRRLPYTIEEAVRYAKQSEFIRRYLPEEIVESYCDPVHFEEEM